MAEPIVEEVIKQPVKYAPSSTDCNIPLSIGVPAICLGTFSGYGAHTREEWIEKESLIKGTELVIKTIKAFAEV